MRSLKISMVASLLLLAGCHDYKETPLVMEKPATSRPIVAVVPVMDQSRHELTWNVSQELTQAIRKRLGTHNHLYLLSEDQVYAMTRKSLQGRDPFGVETAWVRKAYPQNEFVAFFELFEHRETPLVISGNLPEESPAELSIAVRVRVFDLRGEEPKVVLQEVVNQSHHIPQQFTKNESNQVAWGSETFEISPLGIAHEKMCQEIASRVEDYILLNCKS